MDTAFLLDPTSLDSPARQKIGEFFKAVQQKPKSIHPPPFLQTEGNASHASFFDLSIDPRDLFASSYHNHHERPVCASTPKTNRKTAGRNKLFSVEASGTLNATPVTHAVTPHFEFATTPAPHQVLPDTDTEQDTHDENNITADITVKNINYRNPDNINHEETNNPVTMDPITPASKPTRPLNPRVNQLRGYTPGGYAPGGYIPGSYIDPFSPGSMVSELTHHRTPGPLPITSETPADLRNIRQTLAHGASLTFLPSYDDEDNDRHQMELLADSPRQDVLVRSEHPIPAPRIPAAPPVVDTAATADVTAEFETIKNQMDSALREITLRSSDAAEKQNQALRRNQELIGMVATQATEIRELEKTIEEVQKKYNNTREQLERQSTAHEEAVRRWQRQPQGRIEELEETIRHLRSEVSTLQQDNEDIRSHRHAEHYERQMTQEELQRLQKELVEQEGLIQGYQAENEKLLRQNRELAEGVREAERRMAGKQQDLKEEVAKLKAQLTEERDRARRGEETQRELEGVKVEMETLKAEKREQAGMIAVLERELAEAKARLRGGDRAGVEEEREKVGHLEQQIEGLMREHQRRVDELERMKEERKEWEEALSKVKRQTGTGAGTETELGELKAAEIEVRRLQEQVEELVRSMGVVEGVVAGRSKRVKALLEDLRARDVLPPPNAPPGTASKRHQPSMWSEVPLSELGDEDPLWTDPRQVRELRQRLERAEIERVDTLARLQRDHEAEAERLRTRCNELQLRLDKAAAVAMATAEERRGGSDRQGEIDNLKDRLAKAENALRSKNDDVRHYERLYLDAVGGHRATLDDKQRQHQPLEPHVPGVDDMLNSAGLRENLADAQARVVLEGRKVTTLLKEKLALTNAHEQQTKQLKVQVQHLQEQLVREQRKGVAISGGTLATARDRSPGKDRDMPNQSTGGATATPTKGGAEVRQLKAKLTRLEAETKELQQKVARDEAIRLMIGEDVIGRILVEKNPGPDGEKRKRRSKPDGANGAAGGEPDLDVAIADLIGSGDVGGKENVVSAEREVLYAADLKAKEQTPGLGRSVTAGGTKRTGSAFTTDKAKTPTTAQCDHGPGQDDDPTMVLLNLISGLRAENSALRSRAADARGEEEALYVTGGGDSAALTQQISKLTAYIQEMEERFTHREAELSRMVEQARRSGREELDGWKRRWEGVVEKKFKEGERFREEVDKALREVEGVVAGEGAGVEREKRK
ncbi:hypothetical protein BC937DRAFT_89250 [Endogone sp. FLAS-F59071]|nr:hypothetical protein BC937DRAFT_89250 [Endogone sp. FLAS-F59071]|eukprot:RUS18008.1 hypothetical protein BC937DRAFT_89250 [Endogone sp. FLAS-F59071]